MRAKKQKGAQAVEFALVLPFMILIIFAVLDFFLIAYNKAVITNASREAARNGITLTAAAWSPTAVSQVACNYVRTMLISVGDTAITSNCTASTDPQITVTPASSSPPAFNTPITVTVSYQVRGFSLGTWWNLGVGPDSVGAPMMLILSFMPRRS